MAELFNFRYRVPSARASWWNYGNNGAYFVTICTSGRNHYFGNVRNKIMNLSDAGKFAWQCWLEIPEHFPFTELNAFVVMPNHVHGIIIINKLKNDRSDGGGIFENNSPTDSINQFGPQSQNLGSIIRGYKIGVTSQCRRNNIPFGWQPRYHDHIIRHTIEFERIKNYILNNPANWHRDVHHK